MANWVFCNRCFQPPHRTSCFSLTNCGHVYCDACLGKGKKNECLICKAPCRTVLLSKHTDADIQAFFMSIDSLCKKYSRETSQILEFQEKHRKRLLAFYREKISRLEESLRKSVLQIEQLQRLESMEVDLSPSPIRKSEIAAGPARISMISPPQDGRMAPCARRVCHFQRFTMFLHRRLSSLAAPPSVQFWKARGTHQL
ncbi:putative E3 SUMO-protein ligase RNF212 isoform X7 [Homo sapiens]|uniref:putative E3 SUMO-protein ligase RNF212 isoform X7 n=1 Tax=Homo sapiens TaxID=9606 RepID=UPI001FB08942|nr:probable E3 SUMO-protein ligase RNF212 isoform X7 [Homo sapiens]XP_054205697.1 probable E3 SUMO-protein ligase RNF212 isoform X7 [Homo sapiens]